MGVRLILGPRGGAQCFVLGGLGVVLSLGDADFSLGDFCEGDFHGAHIGVNFYEWATPGIKLSDAFGDDIDEDLWVWDDFGSFFEYLAFHLPMRPE